MLLINIICHKSCIFSEFSVDAMDNQSMVRLHFEEEEKKKKPTQTTIMIYTTLPLKVFIFSNILSNNF